MASGNAYEWILQSTTNNADFALTDEERQAAGMIAEFAFTLGAATAAKAGKIASQFKVAAEIFRKTGTACDKITKIGRAMKSFREAGKVLNGSSDIQTSVRWILDNYCFVGTVDVSTYDTENRWAEVAATPTAPLAATPALLRSEVATGWFIMGAGVVALLQVISVRPTNLHSEEDEAAFPELAWA